MSGKKIIAWSLISLVLISASYFFIKPKAASAYYIWKGTELLSNKNYSEAYTAYSMAIQENPHLIEAYVGRAKANLFLKQQDAAFADINQAFSVGANSTEAHFVRGVILASKNQHTLAISEYAVVLKKDPTFHIAQLNIAKSYDRLNDPISAVAAYKKFIASVPPDNPQIAEAKQLLSTAEKKSTEAPVAKLSDWTKVAETTSPNTFTGMPATSTIMEWSSPDKKQIDVINLKFNEKGWIHGYISKQQYIFIPENETMEKSSRRLSVSFSSQDKNLSLSQFCANFLAPIKAKPNLNGNIISSSDTEAYIEVTGPNAYSLTRVIKGTASIVVLSYTTKNPSSDQISYANNLLRNIAYMNQWPKDGPPRPNEKTTPSPSAI